MKLFMRRVQVYFYKPQRLLVATVVATFTFFLLAFGWIQVAKYAKRKINQAITAVSKKTNMPIEVNKITVTPAGASLENIVIGKEANIVISRMTAEVGFVPFTDTFGKLDNLTIHNVKIKTESENAERAVSKMKQTEASDNQPIAATMEKALSRLFTSMPTNAITLRSGGITLVDHAGNSVFTSRGIKLHVNKKARKILFKADLVKTKDGISEKFVQGRLQYAPSKSQYQFFIKRKSKSVGGQDLWSAAGTANKDLTKVQANGSLHMIPSFLSEKIKSAVGDAKNVNINTSISLKREPDNTYVFKSQIKSQGLVVNNPVLSTDQVGQIRFWVETEGRVNLEKTALSVHKFSLKVPDRKTGKYLAQSPKVSGRFDLDLTSTTPIEVKSAGQFVLGATSCQAVIDSSPKGLTPNLDEFRLSGTLSAGVDFRFDTEKPADLFFDVFGTSYNCQVLKAPYSFTKEHLNGAFTLQRFLKGSSEPIEISVNPFSPEYTPIEAIAKTVNMALVTSEDNAFFSHKGIDSFALENALRKNFIEKRIAVGGSTITMQTVKNLYLGNERTISRKLQELFLAWHLERILDKNRILEIYMNIVEFGPGVYGITNAAQHFFGKHPFDLNIVESAYLASVLPSPTGRYHNFCDGRLSPGFKDLVYGLLKRMVHLNRIPYERYASALGIPISFNNNSRHSAWGCLGKSESDDEP